MHQIFPHPVWIGSTGDLRDWKRLYELEIRAVFQVAYEETLPTLPHDLVVCRFPLVDGDENPPERLELAVATLTRLLDQGFACLVCCQAGLSRSPAVVALALARHTRQPFEVGLELVARQIACGIHPGLLRQCRALCKPN